MGTDFNPYHTHTVEKTLAQHTPEVSLGRRKVFIAGACTLLLPIIPRHVFAAELVAVRVWPSESYTRVTLELDKELKSEQFTLKDPHRLVVDVTGLEMSAALNDLVSKIRPNDPFISSIRVAKNRDNVIRIVIDLKQAIKPQIFTLKPIGNYKYRLVMDLYPLEEQDPVIALLKELEQAQGGDQKESIDDLIKKLPDHKAGKPPSPSTPDPKKGSVDKPKSGRLIIVAIDPGHGGEDPGAVGKNGTKEKDVVLKIARALKTKIDQNPNMRAVLTRDGDYYVPLAARVEKARKVSADLFISVHADAWTKPTANGSSVFALSKSGASSSTASFLAKSENNAELIGGVNLNSKDKKTNTVIMQLSVSAQINDSLKVGKLVLSSLGKINNLHKDHVEQAGFAVLKAPDIPSILVETAFISNPEEERKLASASFQNSVATALANGIKSYFEKNPPLAMAQS